MSANIEPPELPPSFDLERWNYFDYTPPDEPNELVLPEITFDSNTIMDDASDVEVHSNNSEVTNTTSFIPIDDPRAWALHVPAVATIKDGGFGSPDPPRNFRELLNQNFLFKDLFFACTRRIHVFQCFRKNMFGDETASEKLTFITPQVRDVDTKNMLKQLTSYVAKADLVSAVLFVFLYACSKHADTPAGMRVSENRLVQTNNAMKYIGEVVKPDGLRTWIGCMLRGSPMAPIPYPGVFLSFPLQSSNDEHAPVVQIQALPNCPHNPTLQPSDQPMRAAYRKTLHTFLALYRSDKFTHQAPVTSAAPS